MEMSRRKQLGRERLEVYLLHLLLAYRPLLQISGLLFFGYAIAITFVSPKAGVAVLVLAILLLACTVSYPGMLCLARIGAWLGTAGNHDD
jgi:hypothetical protein